MDFVFLLVQIHQILLNKWFNVKLHIVSSNRIIILLRNWKRWKISKYLLNALRPWKLFHQRLLFLLYWFLSTSCTNSCDILLTIKSSRCFWTFLLGNSRILLFEILEWTTCFSFYYFVYSIYLWGFLFGRLPGLSFIHIWIWSSILWYLFWIWFSLLGRIFLFLNFLNCMQISFLFESCWIGLFSVFHLLI